MKYKYILLILAILALVAFSIYRNRTILSQSLDYLELSSSINDLEDSAYKQVEIDAHENEEELVEEVIPQLPTEVRRVIPFATQAPLGVWNDFYDEMCEEASAIVANAWLINDSRPILDPNEVDQELKNISEFEKESIGTDVSTTIRQLRTVMIDYMSISPESLNMVEISSELELKKLLVDNIIIAPFAGKELKNPYFRGGGPRYHMLVITGYKEKSFITNDVGTKRGANFEYQSDLLISAIHDFIPEDEGEISVGNKTVLIIKKN